MTNVTRNIPLIPVKAPIASRVYAMVLALFISGSVWAAASSEYARTASVTGVVKNRSFYPVFSQVRGNIGRVFVNAGQAVRRGDALFTVVRPPIEANGGGGQSRDIASMRVENLLSILDTVQAEREMLDREYASLNEMDKSTVQVMQEANSNLASRTKLLEEQIKISQKNLERQEYLYRSKLITMKEFESAKKSVLDVGVGLQAALAEVSKSQATINETVSSQARSRADLRAKKVDLTLRELELSDRIEAIRSENQVTIYASANGLVDSISKSQGDFIDETSSVMLMRVSEAEKPHVQLYLNSAQIGLVSLNKQVKLRIVTYPYEIFGTLNGTVDHVPTAPYQNPREHNEASYIVTLSLDQQPNPRITNDMLVEGMKVEAQLRYAPMSLLRWILVPVYSVSNNYTT